MRYRFGETLYPHEFSAWLGSTDVPFSRMWMNMKSYAFMRAWARDILNLEIHRESLKQGIQGEFLGVQIRTSQLIKDGDIFLIEQGVHTDLSPGWSPYAEEEAQRVSRYDRIMED